MDDKEEDTFGVLLQEMEDIDSNSFENEVARFCEESNSPFGDSLLIDVMGDSHWKEGGDEQLPWEDVSPDYDDHHAAKDAMLLHFNSQIGHQNLRPVSARNFQKHNAKLRRVKNLLVDGQPVCEYYCGARCRRCNGQVQLKNRRRNHVPIAYYFPLRFNHNRPCCFDTPGHAPIGYIAPAHAAPAQAAPAHAAPAHAAPAQAAPGQSMTTLDGQLNQWNRIHSDILTQASRWVTAESIFFNQFDELLRKTCDALDASEASRNHVLETIQRMSEALNGMRTDPRAESVLNTLTSQTLANSLMDVSLPGAVLSGIHDVLRLWNDRNELWSSASSDLAGLSYSVNAANFDLRMSADLGITIDLIRLSELFTRLENASNSITEFRSISREISDFIFRNIISVLQRLKLKRHREDLSKAHEANRDHDPSGSAPGSGAGGSASGYSSGPNREYHSDNNFPKRMRDGDAADNDELEVDEECTVSYLGSATNTQTETLSASVLSRSDQFVKKRRKVANSMTGDDDEFALSKEFSQLAFPPESFDEFCMAFEAMLSKELPSQRKNLCVLCKASASLYCTSCTVWMCQSCISTSHDNSPIPIMRNHTFLDYKPYLHYENDKLKDPTRNNEDAVLICVDYTFMKDSVFVSLEIPPDNYANFLDSSPPDVYKPVVSVFGPTNVGKSFLVASMMGGDETKWPSVAEDGTSAATSAHVTKYDGHVTYNAASADINVVDLEGICASNPPLKFFSKFALPEILMNNDTMKKSRLKLVDEVIPVLSYLFSDVVIYMDVSALHRREYVERVRNYVTSVHVNTSSAWLPALILVQNKCRAQDGDYQVSDADGNYIFNVSSQPEYALLLNELKPFFCHIYILKMPSTSIGIGQYERALREFHKCVLLSARYVEYVRRKRGLYYSERMWYQLVRCQLNEFNSNASSVLSTADGKRKFSSLPELYHALKSGFDKGWMAAARRSFDALSHLNDFNERVIQTLRRIAYIRAGYYIRSKARRNDLHSEAQGGIVIINELERNRSCISCDQGHQCVYSRATHLPNQHKSNALVPRQDASWFNRVLAYATMGLFQENVPHIWTGAFEKSNVQYPDLRDLIFEVIGDGSMEEYLRKTLSGIDSHAGCTSCCNLCLREMDMIRLNCVAGGHYFCEQCLETRAVGKKLYHCPFCKSCTERSFPRQLPPHFGHRVLSLDGDGLKNASTVLILKEIERAFHPVPLSRLFDVICGTGVGGVIALAIWSGKPMDLIHDYIRKVASYRLDSAWTVNGAYRFVMGGSLCSTSGFRKDLELLFNNEHLSTDMGYPLVGVTAFDTVLSDMILFGNNQKHRASLVDISMATLAVWPYMTPFQLEEWVFLDNGRATLNPLPKAMDMVRRKSEGIVSHEKLARNSIEYILSLGTGEKLSTPEKSNQAARNEEASLWDYLSQTYGSSCRRIDPPGLSRLRSYFSSDLSEVERLTNVYLNSSEGKDELHQTFNMIYAGLWCVQDDTHILKGHSNVINLRLREGIPTGELELRFHGSFELQIRDVSETTQPMSFSKPFEGRASLRLTEELVTKLGVGDHLMSVYWVYQNSRKECARIQICGCPFHRSVVE